jgi:hypothetical protein
MFDELMTIVCSHTWENIEEQKPEMKISWLRKRREKKDEKLKFSKEA